MTSMAQKASSDMNAPLVNMSEAAELLPHYMDRDVPVMLWGSPGIGKSDLVRQIAKNRIIDGQPAKLFDWRALLREPVDVRGLPVADLENRKAVWLAPADLPDPIRDGENVILFVDEINVAPPLMQASLYGLVLDRRAGDHKLPDGCRIIAAGNFLSDKGMAQRMPTPLANRMAHLCIEPDAGAFTKYITDNGLDPALASLMAYRPDLVHQMPGTKNSKDTYVAWPSPRQWVTAAKFADAPPVLQNVLMSSVVGTGAATEYIGVIKMMNAAPPIEEIIKDPENQPVPADPSLLYALCGSLASRATPKNVAAIVAYAKRMPPEYEVTTLQQMVGGNPALGTTKPVVTWREENPEVAL